MFARKCQFPSSAPYCVTLRGLFWPANISEGGYSMPELVSRTVRIRRGLVDRLRGFERLYETKVTDGY